ncbi:disease resistance protein RGA2-like [Musa acuminata AAA Group]|uniref:disease resistance protein RGA2-like n=1 Tax=Musa acuminata AAA Group TaxID=214697 RepID=UPI0031CFD10A
MAVSSDLKFVLLEILPTPELMAQGRELRIQNHLEMVHDCIWALNAVIIDAQIRALKEPEVEEWVNDVGIAVADVEDLLRSILSWQPRGAAASNLLPCSFPNVDGVASRHAILLELEEKARRLNYLVRRGSSLCLRKEMMDSTYPRREDEEAKKEYFTILREEVVGRDEDVEKVINKIRWKRQQRSHNVHDDDDDDDDDDGPLFFILFGNYMVGKTSVARLVYHHPWVSKHFDRRVWIDGSKVSSFDAMWVIKEFMRSIAGEPCEDVWLFYDRFGGSHRYLIILDDFFIGLDEQDKFFQLEYFFLLMGEPGSLVMLIGATRIQRLPHTVGKLLNLRYLNLSMSEIQLSKLPGQIHNLRSLRIMKLAFCARLHRLPKSITSLVNLQELDLEGCHGLVELPEDFGNLRKLTNLNMIKCASLTQMPSGLEQMHNLQKLSGYSIRKVGRIEDVISELQPLIVLEELDIWNLQVVSNPTDALTPPMLLQDKLPKLKRLALHWKWYNVDDVEIASDVISLQVLEGLQPNIYLSKLEITSYVGKEFPRWIKEANLFSYNLEEIRLVNLRRCERLPPLGHLPYIRILEISGMDLITVVNETFYTPDTLTSISLDKLIFSEMPRLEKWAEPREGNAEWVIKELTLIQCPKLRTWETDVGVRKLNIWMNNEMLWHCRSVGWQRLIEGIHELTIVGCQELMCLPPVLRSIPWFWELTIIRCNKLISIPDWLVEKEFLKSLFISGCPELSYIPPKLKRRSDLRLQHSGCPKLRF